jgi:hypothetical protein
MYENPVTIKEDPDTGLLLLVDGNGKTIARAATPGDLVQLGASKGVYSGDLPPPTDPRGTPKQAAEVQNDAANKNAASGQTAEAKVVNDTPPSTVGAGQGNNNPTPPVTSSSESLSTTEVAKLETNQDKAETAASTNASQTFPLQTSEKSVEDQQVGIFSKPTSAIGGLSNNSTGPSNTSVTDKTVPGTKLYNKLHDFTGYTYRITLFLLTSDELATLSTSPKTFNPKWALISSGGGFAKNPTYNWYTSSNNTGRHPDFMEDFYFDSLNLTTVVGLNSKSKATNAIDIKFNIIEPYGMTLLDRLFSACYTSAGCPNYVDNPYLLQIDFLSNVEEANKNNIKGNLIESKRIPIKFIEFKIKPSASGTTYSVRAMPYNHVAFLQSAAATPVNLSVTAKTVGEYFSSDPRFKAEFDQNAATQLKTVDTALNEYGRNAVRQGQSQESVNDYISNAKAALTYSTKSYTAGYNTYFYNIAFKSKLYEVPPYQIAFNIDDRISNSLILDPDKISSDKSAMGSGLDDLKKQAISGAADANFKIESTTNILAGTSIINVIDRVMAASEYIKKQIQEAKQQDEQASQQDASSQDDSARTSNSSTKKQTIQYAPTDWYKIIPSVVLGDYDKQAKAYSKQLIYSIVPYVAANSYHPGFKFTKINASQCVRTYNYFYTGLNQDIVQLDIDFDATFITGITTYAKQAARGGNDNSSDSQVTDNTQVSDKQAPKWIPYSTKPTPVDTQMAGQKASRSDKDITVASVSRSLYSAYPRGDMLNIKVKIVGDPAFIKQDDVYVNPLQQDYGTFVTPITNANGTSIPVNSDGQIIFDTSQVYVQLIVRGTVDVDDTTGITNKKLKLSSGEITSGSFSGIYKVMVVESVFTRGKFEQIVELIRMPDDLTDIETKSTSSTNTSTPSNTTGNDNSQQAGPAGGTPFTNPRPDNVPAVDPTLKAVGNSNPVNPSNSTAGNGTPTPPPQPTNASAGNVNNAGNADILPQQNSETPNAADEAANAKAKELSVQIEAVRTNYDNYYKEWAVKYNVYKNASAEEKNTVANVQARIDLLKEITQKQREIATNELRPILSQELAIRPTTTEVVRLAEKIASVAEYLANDKKQAEASLDKLTQQLERIK